MRALRAGAEPPPPDPLAEALGTAAMHDPDVFRAWYEIRTCLALQEDVLARPGFMDKLNACAGKPGPNIPAPDRQELLALLA
ncbi:MAG: hypothetical protein ACRDY7_02645 [Acidimicrobiia bacterium]